MTTEERNLYDFCTLKGQSAASIDMPETQNPFTPGTPQYTWWLQGWRNYHDMAEVA